MIKMLIYLKVDFNQSFFTYTVNLATSSKFLGSGIKHGTSEPDSTKVGNELFN